MAVIYDGSYLTHYGGAKRQTLIGGCMDGKKNFLEECKRWTAIGIMIFILLVVLLGPIAFVYIAF